MDSYIMKTLVLMRHAKSDWSSANLADHDRPLNARGNRAAPRMAQLLQDEQVAVDVILASSACRVQQTLQHLTETWAGEAVVMTEPSLYLASVSEIKSHIDVLHDSWNSAMVVGHNPGLGAMLCTLSDQDLDMPTACVAVLQADTTSWRDSIRKCKWHLHAYWKPRDFE